GTAFAVLGAATLWAGCASIPAEMSDKRFAAVRVSPAPTFAVFAGRWAGLVALDAALLALALAGVFFQVRARGLGPGRTEVRRLLAPTPEAAAKEALEIVEWAAPEKKADPQAFAGALASVVRDLDADSLLPLPPGKSRTWTFAVPEKTARRGATARVSFRFLSSYGTSQGAAGLLEAKASPDSPAVASAFSDNMGNGTLEMEFPLADLGGAKEFSVSFENRENPETGASVLLGWRESARVTVPAGGLAANLFRAWVVLLAGLSLLAALGLLCGCALSFPVAAFAATCAVATFFASSSEAYDANAVPVHSHSGGQAGSSGKAQEAIERAAAAMSRAVRGATAPVTESDALSRLGDCIEVEAVPALRAAAFGFVAVPLFFGLAGAAALRRRETP
ncbi:MAG: hypothetical protein IJ678_05140, partial [Kiritimatiellae bacterium]|nr:hypothetical protein [Kiritimatiellia bacterium]